MFSDLKSVPKETICGMTQLTVHSKADKFLFPQSSENTSDTTNQLSLSRKKSKVNVSSNLKIPIRHTINAVMVILKCVYLTDEHDHYLSFHFLILFSVTSLDTKITFTL